MSKNSKKQASNIARQLSKTKTEDKLPVRVKTSIYVDKNIWKDFKKLTEKPRGNTSELLESFMSEFIRVNKK